MALEIPWDLPGNNFTRGGLLTIDGDAFEGNSKVGTKSLLREINYLKNNVAAGNLKTRSEWIQVRDIILLWCFSNRCEEDHNALNDFLNYVGLAHLHVPTNLPPKVLMAIEAKYLACSMQATPPPDWIRNHAPPQRLPSANGDTTTTDSITTSTINNPTNNNHIHDNTHHLTQIQTQPQPTNHLSPSTDLNTNPKYAGKYTFVEHKQEYEGHQFQCIFRCLKDKKHCRKAPVREMNRHLRDRHHFRQGFKIAGVDWEKKVWRGAGADHEECVGRIVEKDSNDEVDGDVVEEDEDYVVV